MATALATGTFEVKLSPLAPYAQSEDPKLGRMSIDKQFHGDLEAVSKGTETKARPVMLRLSALAAHWRESAAALFSSIAAP